MRHPVADAERLLDLNREAGEQVAERVLQREADDHGADRRRRDDPSCMNSVAASANSAMTIASWTIFGKRSGSRSARHGLMARATSAFAMPKASSSGWRRGSGRRASAGSRPYATSAAAIGVDEEQEQDDVHSRLRT